MNGLFVFTSLFIALISNQGLTEARQFLYGYNDSTSNADHCLQNTLRTPITVDGGLPIQSKPINIDGRLISPSKAITVEDCPKTLTRDVYLHVFGEYCYEFVLYRDLEFDSARADCNSRGGDLVKIFDQETQDFLYKTLRESYGQKDEVWIGLTDKNAEDTWEWMDGTIPEYDNWAEGQPGVFHGLEDCAALDPSDGGKWHDYKCEDLFIFVDAGHRYICQYKSNYRPPQTTTERPPVTDTTMTNPPQSTSMTNPPQSTTMTNPPQSTTMANPPQSTTMTNPPQTTTMSNSPQSTTMTNPTQTTTMTNPPQSTTMTNPPQTTTMSNPPQSTTMTNPPQTTTMTNPPQSTTMSNPPQTTTMTNPPQSTTMTNPPQSTTMTNPPQTTTMTNPPQSTTMTNPPQSTTISNPPQSTTMSNPPQTTTMTNPPQTTTMTNPPQTTTMTNPPQPTTVSNPPSSVRMVTSGTSKATIRPDLCPTFVCDKDCGLSSYKRDATGCPLCECDV